MQPCGALVLRVRLGERWGPSLTVSGQFVREALIHMHKELLRPRLSSLIRSLLRRIVLNAELESIKTIVDQMQ